MSRKTAKKQKDDAIKKIERELSQLEWKQLAAAAVGVAAYYVKEKTKSGLVGADGKEKPSEIPDKFLSAALGVSARVGQDYLQQVVRLRSLLGLDKEQAEASEEEGSDVEPETQESDGEDITETE